MIAIICAIASGMTIVLSRSINGYLAKKIGPYQSTFFNYFTGLLTSSILLFFTLLPAFKNNFIYKDRSNNVSWRNNWCL